MNLHNLVTITAIRPIAVPHLQKDTTMNGKIRIFCIPLSGALALAVSGLAAAQAKPPIKIGVLTPLSGTYAPIGQQVLWGSELAVKEINAAGGITQQSEI